MARILAHGTQLQMGDGAGPEVFTAIAQLTSVGLPSWSRAAVDTSDHDTSGGMDFSPAALYDAGGVVITGHIDAAITTHGYTSGGTGFINAATDGDTKNFRIITANSTWRVTFTGFFTSFSGDAPSDGGSGKMTFSAEIKITGEIVYEDIP